MAEILEKVSVGCFVLAIALAVIALVLWFRLDLFRGVKERRRTALQRKKKKQLTGKNRTVVLRSLSVACVVLFGVGMVPAVAVATEKTTMVVSVSFDNNDAAYVDAAQTGYFTSARTATLTVTAPEGVFDVDAAADAVSVAATNAAGETIDVDVLIGEWEKVGEEEVVDADEDDGEEDSDDEAEDSEKFGEAASEDEMLSEDGDEVKASEEADGEDEGEVAEGEELDGDSEDNVKSGEAAEGKPLGEEEEDEEAEEDESSGEENDESQDLQEDQVEEEPELEEAEETYILTVSFLEEGCYVWDFSYEIDGVEIVFETEGATSPWAFVLDWTAPTGVLIAQSEDCVWGTWSGLAKETRLCTFFSDQQLQVCAEATDDFSALASVSYFVSDSMQLLSEEALKNLGESNWQSSEEVLLKENSQSIVYGRLCDVAGNVSFVCSDWMIVDGESPVISVFGAKVEDKTIFNEDVYIEVEVEDAIVNGVCSGIQSVDYTVFCDGTQTQSGKLFTFTGDRSFGEEVTQSLRTEFVVLAEENNGDVTVELCVYDGVGHCTRQTIACVIDTVAPQISVSYDNNEAQNECYFNSARTATIVVTDEHFDADGVSILKTMKSEQENVAVTEVESVTWTTQGNQHTATVSFIEDGTYTLAIGVTDLAGNESNTIDYGNCVAGERFVIDTGIDAFTVEGVEDAAAYSGALSLQLVISDANLDAYDVSLKRTRMYDVDADVTELLLDVTERSETLVAWIADAFAETEETDGIYTLSLWATDLAGNEQEQQLTFSINRFGSVYVFDAYLLSLLQQDGGYLQSVEEDLVITEYNATPLDGTSLLLYITKDGHPLKDVAYSVSREKTDAADVGASGWYTYVYTFYKENFCEDGLYKISISSVDSAGNQSENTNRIGSEISFWVDQTSPELTAVDDLKRSIFQGMTAEISYTVFDAVGLQSVAVYVDDALYEEAVTDFDADQNNYTGSFSLTAKKAGQQVRIVVTDLAGNTSDVSCGAFSGGHLFLRNASDTGLAYLQRVSETLQEEKWMVVPVVVIGCVLMSGLLLLAKRKRLLTKRQPIFDKRAAGFGETEAAFSETVDAFGETEAAFGERDAAFGEKIDGFDKTVAVKG